MKNVKGGFAYIDMGIYGEVTSAANNNVASNELAVVKSNKTIVVTGLNLKTVGVFTPFIASFTSATASGVTTWTAAYPGHRRKHRVLLQRLEAPPFATDRSIGPSRSPACRW